MNPSIRHTTRSISSDIMNEDLLSELKELESGFISTVVYQEIWT